MSHPSDDLGMGGYRFRWSQTCALSVNPNLRPSPWRTIGVRGHSQLIICCTRTDPHWLHSAMWVTPVNVLNDPKDKAGQCWGLGHSY